MKKMAYILLSLFVSQVFANEVPLNFEGVWESQKSPGVFMSIVIEGIQVFTCDSDPSVISLENIEVKSNKLFCAIADQNSLKQKQCWSISGKILTIQMDAEKIKYIRLKGHEREVRRERCK